MATTLRCGEHPIDRLMLEVIADEEGDVGFGSHEALASRAADRLVAAMRDRRRQRKPFDRELAAVERMGRAQLEALCSERLDVCMG